MLLKYLRSVAVLPIIVSSLEFAHIIGVNYSPIHFTQIANAQESLPNSPRQRGSSILLNNQKLPINWVQWYEGNQLRTGISDTGAMRFLGIDLLNTNNPSLQPIKWFSYSATVNSKFLAPYRYLDLTELLGKSGVTISPMGESLRIDTPPCQVKNIASLNPTTNKQITINLDCPIFWEISQGKDEAIIKIWGNSTPELIARFAPLPSANQTSIGEEEGDEKNILSAVSSLFSPSNNNSLSSLVSLDAKGNFSSIKIKLSNGNKVRVSSSADSLILDIRPDNLQTKNIAWKSGLNWQQKYVQLTNLSFPVTTLEIDPKMVELRPITTNNYKVEGVAPLVNTARNIEAIAAINSGFFNRNNKLPLGAIKNQEQWLSGPILGRGAIAWDNRGKFKMGRLALQEILITSSGENIPIAHLNSAYVKAGVSRYTPAWGLNYTTLSDQEIIILVENNRVVGQFSSVKAGQQSFPIPLNGYLLTLRSNASLASKFLTGTQINLISNTNPTDFANYPYIMGGGPLLLQNSQIVLNGELEQFSPAFNKQGASRSAIALSQRGTLLLVAVHNRVGGNGPTLLQFAQILKLLGAVDALNLDGGSSTSLYLGGELIDRSAATAARVNNGIGIFLK
jgi:exopolysaccharide biosynthesis protein